MNVKPLINGRAYDWAQVTVKMSTASFPFTTIESINYDERATVTNNYGAGRMPVSRGYGNIEPTASITLQADDVFALMDNVPSGRLTDIPEFDLIVFYKHPDAAKARRDVIRNCKFVNNPLALNQNDPKFSVELELVVSHINYGGRRFEALFD